MSSQVRCCAVEFGHYETYAMVLVEKNRQIVDEGQGRECLYMSPNPLQYVCLSFSEKSTTSRYFRS